MCSDFLRTFLSEMSITLVEVTGADPPELAIIEPGAYI
jgi:hypothetical protein